MVIDMNEARLSTIEQIREFLAGTADVAFTVPSEDVKRRRFIATVLKRFRYFRLSKGPRGVLFSYMQRLSGYSRQLCSANNRSGHLVRERIFVMQAAQYRFDAHHQTPADFVPG